MKKLTLITITTVSLLSLLGAGCGSTTTDGTSTAQPIGDKTAMDDSAPVIANGVHACDYLTKDIASGVLGEVNEPSETSSGAAISSCSYTPANGDIAVLSLLIKRNSADTEATGAKASSKSLSGVDPEDVAGLGDSAYWAGGKLNQLNVFKDNDWYILSAMMSGFNKDKAIKTMQEVLKN